MQEAYENAEDALCLMLYDMEECGEKIPQASRPADIKTKGDAFVSIVPCDTLDYRRQYDNKAVKKTLTIPSWLNTMAEREGINFSATLQDALKQQQIITYDKSCRSPSGGGFYFTHKVLGYDRLVLGYTKPNGGDYKWHPYHIKARFRLDWSISPSHSTPRRARAASASTSSTAKRTNVFHYKKVTDSGEEVKPEDIVKGYEYEKGNTSS